LKGEVAVLNGEVGVLNGEVGVLNGAIGVLNGAIGVLNGAIGVLKCASVVLKGEVAVLKGAIGVLKGVFTELCLPYNFHPGKVPGRKKRGPKPIFWNKRLQLVLIKKSKLIAVTFFYLRLIFEGNEENGMVGILGRWSLWN